VALLKQFETDYGIIRVTRERDGTLAYFQDGSFHSQATSKGVSVCAYVHVIHEIIRQRHARNILIIGCAGGTLATMLSRGHCKVTVVDINLLHRFIFSQGSQGSCAIWRHGDECHHRE